MKKQIILHFLLLFPLVTLWAQENNQHEFEILARQNEEILLYQRLNDIADMDIINITSLPLSVTPPAIGCEFIDSLRNLPFVVRSFVFFPKALKSTKKYPLIVMPHGGVHGNVGTYWAHLIRELVAQGYIVTMPEYRGSIGYGQGYYEAIDYGGRENEDVLAVRDYMAANYDVVDSTRIGIIGWSHGGMITLMNILQYPDKYACGFAGVPVSDVAYRLSYLMPEYADNFTPAYHVGATPEENPEEYARRSPVSYAHLLRKPLRIATCVNDNDVSWTEVNRMIEALKRENKEFEYTIYPWMPGSHQFQLIDNPESAELRWEVYNYLARYLSPAHPFRSVKELRAAGYRYR